MKKRVFGLKSIAFISIAIALQWPFSALSAPKDNISFRPDECWFNPPRELSTDCGYLSTPETYGRNNSRILQLPVVIFNSDSAGQPVLYVDGGPGSDSGLGNDSAGRNWELTIADSSFLQNRPVVIMAQRGTADETSSLLKCSILGEPRLRIGLTHSRYDISDLENQVQRQLVNCRDQALAADYDLRAYNTENSAQDIISLRTALAIPKWDIIAISYGSRPALLATAKDGDHVGALILDGPDIPGSLSSFKVATYFNASFSRLEKDCSQIKSCAKRFPDMPGYLKELMDTAEKKRPWTAFRRHGEERISYLRLTPERVMNTLYNGFYTEGAIALMPRALYRAARNDISIFGALSGSILLDPFFDQRAYGMALSIDCTEFNRDAALKTLDDESKKDPLYSTLIESRRKGLSTLCPIWLGESYYRTVTKKPKLGVIKTPILALSGVYDPVTPIEVVRPFRNRLPNVQMASVPAMGHGVLFRQNCTAEIARSFLESPLEEVDTSCLKDVAQFPDFNLNTAPPMPEPFIKLKTYESKIDGRSE